MHADVSDPQSPSYGKYLSLREVHDRYSPLTKDKERVLSYLQSLDQAVVYADQWGDMVTVTAPVSAIEQYFGTRLGFVSHVHGTTKKIALRAKDSLIVPTELHPLIDFISLNIPVNHNQPRAFSALSSTAKTEASSSPVLSVFTTNEEAHVYFKPICGSNNISLANSQSPPCNSSLPGNRPSEYQFIISKHTDSGSELDQKPIVQTVHFTAIYCFEQITGKRCNGLETNICTCIVKLSSLPKYVQLRVTAHALYSTEERSTTQREQFLGSSQLFVLADVATPAFISALYGIPPGLSVKHGSNQSVVELIGLVICHYYLHCITDIMIRLHTCHTDSQQQRPQRLLVPSGSSLCQHPCRSRIR